MEKKVENLLQFQPPYPVSLLYDSVAEARQERKKKKTGLKKSAHQTFHKASYSYTVLAITVNFRFSKRRISKNIPA